MDPTSYFVDYQIWLVAPMLLVTMVLHFFWQRHCDRKDGWDPALHRGDHAELDEQGTESVQAPTWYALLPIIPFVLMMTFSKLLVSDIKMSVEVAMLLSVFIGMLCELLRSRSVRTAFAGLSSFLDGMGKVFGPVVALIVCAELFAESLKAIGALKGGQLVEVSRGDLVGRYTGHTAPLTNSVIQSALGGVLFIDEAYSLYRGEQDSFGLEAIDTLVKGMEDHRDELVVILAGYTREMETFLTANSGLASRFPNKIEFPDYTADELLDITNVLARGKGYRLAESCTEPLRGYYERRQAEDARTAGNGRLARNTLEKAIFNQSRRLVAEPAAELDVILPGDLELQ